MIRVILISFCLLANCFVITACMAENRAPVTSRAKEKKDKFNGWGHLAEKLIADGIDREEVEAVFNAPGFPKFTNVPFKIAPQEGHNIYGFFLKPQGLQTAMSCLKRYYPYFKAAEERFNINRHVITAIMYVETQCGEYIGKSIIFERLIRIANIDDPNNIIFNYHRLKKDDKTLDLAKVEARAKYLVETFYPEILAIFEIAHSSGTDVFELKGSFAGAFGFTQFLPSSFLHFGIDGNSDGKISLFTPADAIFSTANFLSSYGWRDDATTAEKKQTVWKYNHSAAYVDTILQVAEFLDKNDKGDVISSDAVTSPKKVSGKRKTSG